MLKLYKSIDSRLHYWETWCQDRKTTVIHWGIVGERGQKREIRSGLFTNIKKVIQKEVYQKLSEGYAEYGEDKMTILDIEYKVDGFGTNQDLTKRHRLEDILNELLGWTGLGNVDGGSIGNGTMEVCCLVIDFEIAKKTIEQELKNR
jgi:hypothetical protein